MRALTLGSIVLAALLLVPAAEAATFADVDGKWFWNTTGYVRVSGGPGVPAHAVIFADETDFFFRVTFDAANRVYIQCLNGDGFLSAGGPAVPLDSCSLDISGAFAVPRASLSASAGQLPTDVGRYLGDIGAGAAGNGSFRIA